MRTLRAICAAINDWMIDGWPLSAAISARIREGRGK